MNIRERRLAIAGEIQSRKAFAVLENTEKKDVCMGRDAEGRRVYGEGQ